MSSKKNNTNPWPDKKVKDWDKDGKSRKKGNKASAKKNDTKRVAKKSTAKKSVTKSTTKRVPKTIEKEKIERFFGKVNYTANGYFTFNHTPSDDVVIMATTKVRWIKGVPFFVIGNYEAIRLKKTQIMPILNDFMLPNQYAVKVQRHDFDKIYTFNEKFDDIWIEKPYTFSFLKKLGALDNMSYVPFTIRKMN